MPTQSWSALLNPTQAANLPAAAALASSAALTDISPGAAANGSLVIPANSLTVGSVLRVTAAGFFSTTGTPTLLLGLYWGGAPTGTLLCGSGAVTTPSGAVNLPFRLEATLAVRTAGSAGTIMPSGVLHLGSSLAAFSVIPVPSTALAAVTVDLTASKALTLGAQWGAASASNSVTCTQFLVESVA